MEYPKNDPITPNYNRDDLGYAVVTLQKLLGLEYTLYVRLQNFHWNVTGMFFRPLHKLFGGQYEEVGKFIDQIAEQIRKYGAAAPGSMMEFGELSAGMDEFPGRLVEASAMIQIALDGHELLASYLNSFKLTQLDLATQNLVGNILDFHMQS